MQQGPHQIEGSWTNQLGSTLEIGTVNNGRFNGTYTTAVGNAQNFVNDVNGTIIEGEHGKTLVAMQVAWRHREEGKPSSLTSWTGLFDPKTQTIDTQWLLVSNDDSLHNWSSFRHNKDLFTRPSTKK